MIRKNWIGSDWRGLLSIIQQRSWHLTLLYSLNLPPLLTLCLWKPRVLNHGPTRPTSLFSPHCSMEAKCHLAPLLMEVQSAQLSVEALGDLSFSHCSMPTRHNSRITRGTLFKTGWDLAVTMWILLVSPGGWKPRVFLWTSILPLPKSSLPWTWTWLPAALINTSQILNIQLKLEVTCRIITQQL